MREAGENGGKRKAWSQVCVKVMACPVYVRACAHCCSPRATHRIAKVISWRVQFRYWDEFALFLAYVFIYRKKIDSGRQALSVKEKSCSRRTISSSAPLIIHYDHFEASSRSESFRKADLLE